MRNSSKKIMQLNNQVVLAKAEDPGFANKVINDLDILEGEIDYDYDPQITAELKIDKVSNLQPLSVLEQKLRATVKDEKELEVALKDLRIKYRDITNSSNEVYNQEFKKAKIIAFNREGGHNDLAANGIDINDFKEEDQKILKNGQPENSDIDTLIMLEDNPEELKDNLDKYDYRLNRKDFLALEDYAAKKLDTPEKILEVKVDNEMLDIEIKRAGFDDIIDKDNEKEEYKTNYQEVKAEWKRRVDLAQIANKGEKISREAKRKILQEILEDKVFTGEKTGMWWWSKDKTAPNITLEFDPKDDAYVKVGDEEIMLSSINPYMRAKIKQWLKGKNIEPTAQAIAYWWVTTGKPTVNNDTDFDIWQNSKMNKLIK